jgi:predicted P-loop ATPase
LEKNMTQHPFDREFSEEEAAKLNAEQKQTESGDELNEEDLEEIAGGIATFGINEGGITKGINEGGITAGWKEGGGIWDKDGNDIPTK